MGDRLIDTIGQFTTIPNSVIEMWPEIGLDAFALFVCLRYHTSKSGNSWPSYETISEETTMKSPKRISKALKSLEANGLLERRRRYGKSTMYILKMPQSFRSGTISPSVAERSVLPQRNTNQINLTRLKELEKDASAQTADVAPKKKKERDPLLDNEAIMAYREEAHLHVPVSWRGSVARVVTDIELWREVVHEWIGRGWNKQNIRGLLDAYRAGGIKTNGRARGFDYPSAGNKKKKTGQEAVDFLEREARRFGFANYAEQLADDERLRKEAMKDVPDSIREFGTFG